MAETVKPIQVPEVVRGAVVPDSGALATGLPGVQVLAAPTQVRRPWRSTIRTALQAGIPIVLALGLVVPQVVQVILDESGESLPDGFRAALLGISAAAVAVSAILARVMAIPQVEALLRRFLPFLSAAPKEK